MQRVLSMPHSHFGIIADGRHARYFLLRTGAARYRRRSRHITYFFLPIYLSMHDYFNDFRSRVAITIAYDVYFRLLSRAGMLSMIDDDIS